MPPEISSTGRAQRIYRLSRELPRREIFGMALGCALALSRCLRPTSCRLSRSQGGARVVCAGAARVWVVGAIAGAS